MLLYFFFSHEFCVSCGKNKYYQKKKKNNNLQGTHLQSILFPFCQLLYGGAPSPPKESAQKGSLIFGRTLRGGTPPCGIFKKKKKNNFFQAHTVQAPSFEETQTRVFFHPPDTHKLWKIFGRGIPFVRKFTKHTHTTHGDHTPIIQWKKKKKKKGL